MSARGHSSFRTRIRVTLQNLSVLAWHDDDEAAHGPIPMGKFKFRPRTARIARVLLHQAPQQVPLTEVRYTRQLHQRRVASLLHLAELVEHECEPATHSRGEVTTDAAEHDDGPASHVFAAVIADP